MSDLAGKIFLAPAGQDACRWYRLEVPSTMFDQDQIVWASDFTGKDGVTTLGWEDLSSLHSLVVQRPVNDTVLSMLETLVKRVPRPLIVVELDDDLWSLPTHNPAYAYYHEGNRLKNLSRACTLADRVVVSTAHLADAVREHAWPREVVVVPNTLPYNFEFVSGDPVRSLVFSGGGTHARDVEHAFRSIRTILKSDRIEATLIGSDYRDVLKGAAWVPWTKTVPQHYRRMARFVGSVGLAPLKVDTFNRSKSNIRLLEYAASGILLLATPYGPYANSPAVDVSENKLWKHAVREVLALPDATKVELMRIQQAWAKKFVVSNFVQEWKAAWM